MSLPFAIAGVQMMVPALVSNLTEVLHRIDLVMIRFPWTQMIVFSELAVCGPVPNAPVSLPGPEEQALQAAAAKHGIWLIPGSVFERGADGKLYNTASVINPAGVVVDRYRKMFPFMPYEKEVTGGTDFCVFDVPGLGRCGLSICYDIWIPETTRTLTAMGAEVLIHPVLTGTIDRDAEMAIARATAAQFQCYVIDINGLGAGGIGRSCIVDPTGTVLSQAGGSSETLPVEVDFARVRRQRETGVNGLGQPLKSFRDRTVDFSVYRPESGTDAYLRSLGPLVMPMQGGSAGLVSLSPEATTPIPPRKLV